MPEHTDAAMPTEEYFYDRLESYFDLRNSMSGPVVKKLATKLATACTGVQAADAPVTDAGHQFMVAQIVNNSAEISRWRDNGHKLNEAATMIKNALVPPLNG